MFLIILEDSEIRLCNTVSNDDLAACDDGIIDIINLNTDKPMQYYNGDWHDIDEIQ